MVPFAGITVEPSSMTSTARSRFAVMPGTSSPPTVTLASISVT